jgi:glyoxylase-like metal-dependent hydrolase (beta-lactamase superfamily II)
MALQIADRWFELRKIDDDITHLWEPYVDPLIRCNIWHVRGRNRDLLVDTGLGVASLREAARELLEKPVLAVATHTHYDHVGGHHEFAECVVHRAEAEDLRQPEGFASLRASGLSEALQKVIADSGYEIGEELITALPRPGYDLGSYRVEPAAPTRIVDEGDVIDIGNRAFEVLHLPGHSPGSMGLWEAATGTLFSGDAIYDGPLIDGLDHSNIDDYVRTMLRLRALPVSVVHAGHDPSFGRARLIELADGYLASKGRAAPDAVT